MAPLVAGLPLAVVMAEPEFESWFVASATKLIGEGGLQSGVVIPDAPDELRNPKGWLTAHMDERDRAYSPTLHQARFTERFDMQLARDRSPSFDHCFREVERLIRAVCHV